MAHPKTPSHPTRLKILAGAPLASSLKYDETTLLDNKELDPAISALLGGKATDPASHPPWNDHTSDASIKWRLIGPSKIHPGAKWSQPYYPNRSFPGSSEAQGDLPISNLGQDEDNNNNNNNVLGKGTGDSIPISFQSVSMVPDDTTIFEATPTIGESFKELSQTEAFIEHSLVLHDTLVSSNIAPPDSQMEENYDDDDGDASNNNTITTSFGSILSDPQSESNPSFSAAAHGSHQNPSNPSNPNPIPTTNIPPPAPPPIRLPPDFSLSPLSSLPTPSHLQHIHPQTPTPHLLCCITSLPPPRLITIRRQRQHPTTRPMILRELLVSDESRSTPFSISFWFPSPPSPPPPHHHHPLHQIPLQRTLASLKPGDIVLFLHIALAVYRNTVYGQSLNPSITRSRTIVEVLMRGNGVPVVPTSRMPAPVKERFHAVRKWAGRHVVSDYVAGGGEGGGGGGAGGGRGTGNSRNDRSPQKKKRRVQGIHGGVRGRLGDDGLPPDSMEG